MLHASSRPRLAATPLRFASTSPPSGCAEDLHLQAVKHARRTTKPLRGRRWIDLPTLRRPPRSSRRNSCAVSPYAALRAPGIPRAPRRGASHDISSSTHARRHAGAAAVAAYPTDVRRDRRAVRPPLRPLPGGSRSGGDPRLPGLPDQRAPSCVELAGRRRLGPTVYVRNHRARVQHRRGSLLVSTPEGSQRIPLEGIDAVVVLGGAQITTQASTRADQRQLFLPEHCLA